MPIKLLSTKKLDFLAGEYNMAASFLEKDWYTQHVLGIMAGCSSSRFQLVFGGGTSLSKGYQIIKRFSEDIDFKVQLLQPDAVVSKESARKSRGAFQASLLEAILESSPDLKLSGEVFKRNDSTFVKFDISYPSQYVQNPALRSIIQVELTFQQTALEPRLVPLSSIIAQFQQEPPEISNFPCVNLAETAADKIASLSWRVFDEPPDSENYDPRNIRHLYDLAYIAPQIIDDPDWVSIAAKTTELDLVSRPRNIKVLAEASGEYLAALVPRLTKEPLYQKHYEDFVQLLSYEASPLSFSAATEHLSALTKKLANDSTRLL